MLIKSNMLFLALVVVAIIGLYFITRRYRLNKLEDSAEEEFTVYFQKRGNYTPEEIKETRKWVSKIFRIPISKIAPGLSLEMLRKTTDWFGSYYLDLEMLYAELEKICQSKKIDLPKQEFTNLDDVVLFYLKINKAD